MIIKKWLFDALAIGLGSFAMALGVAFFLLPNQVVAGGAPGVTVLLSPFLDLSPGVILLIINGALMLLGLRALGPVFLFRTLIAVVLISLFTDALLYLFKGVVVTDNRLVSAIYAGVLLGVAIGLIFRANASAGGWSILVRLIADRVHLGVGQMAVIMDGTVVLLSVFVFKDLEAGLFAGITVFITGRMIDWVLTEKSRMHLVNIYSAQAAALQQHIEDRVGVRGTLFLCDSHESENRKDFLHLSVDWRDLKALKQTIDCWAPDAYVTVTKTVDVMGFGVNENSRLNVTKKKPN
tara:strand:+ start:22684 stop:23565 length:882 start_codon:yes stop_codon:yes gene_type:complete